MDQMLANAARSLSSAIGGRWGGWFAVAPEALSDGPGGLVVTYDPAHAPGLVVGRFYQDYPVRLVPAAPPG